MFYKFETSIEDIISASIKLNVNLNYELAETIFNLLNIKKINDNVNCNGCDFTENDKDYYQKILEKSKIGFEEIRKELNNNNFFNLI